jgi:outer membrane lipoprotein SlyB
MTIQKNFQAVLGVSALLLLGACANGNNTPANPTGNAMPPSSVYSTYGVVQSIELVQQPAAAGSGNVGAATIAGAVVGGILGHQIGGGSGNTAATVLGAAGGAYAGNTLEKNNQAAQTVSVYKFTVRLQDGSYLTSTQTANADLRVGDRVQIDNGVLHRY